MGDKVKAYGEHAVRVLEGRRNETAGRNLKGNIPEMVHPGCQCQHDFSHDLHPHVQCRVRIAPRFQRKRRPTCLILHLSKDLLNQINSQFPILIRGNGLIHEVSLWMRIEN